MKVNSTSITTLNIELSEQERAHVASVAKEHNRYFTGREPRDGTINRLLIMLDKALNQPE